MLGLLVGFAFCLVVSVNSHGYLVDPVARSSAWRFDPAFQQCCSYHSDMEMYCGGLQHQWTANAGKCSICGERYDTPNKLFEKGGSKYLGKIVKTYTQGQVIDVTTLLSANHKGYFEYRVCSLDNTNSDATQECLNQRVLKIAGTDSTRFRDVGNYGSTSITVRVQLPADLACRHCVFQWKYTAGNNWGTNPQTGESGLGMGIENETFMGCADIAIVGNGSPVNTPAPPVIIPTAAPGPDTTTTTTTPRPSGGTTTWSADGVQYRVGDTVMYDGVRYRCVNDHVSFPGAHPSPVTWAWWTAA